MDLQIQDRAAVITGAAGGMGLETARILRQEGARVLMTDLDESQLALSVQILESDGLGGDGLRSVVADLRSQAGADAVARAVDWDLDILVHTAGITGAKGDPLTDITEDDWMEAWQVDMMSAVRMAKAVVPQMLDRGWGRVVFVTSENVAQPYDDEVVYNGAKASLLTFAKALAQRYAPQGVLVNSVAPAFIATDMTDGMMEKKAEKNDETMDQAIDEFLEEDRPHLVLDRRGRPEEVAAVIAFLCSERASFVVGSNYRVDGGSVASIDL
ncbi:SDR family NAD(P)-dependent oxidoreductase [Rubrivirga sp. IMCC45206]|uniref:SDR family NAD(P)-dependent oxidoreductase n=1 Tax=Rubrivirga sp. IMCC45206 TaxID=3391614 RepID=UPI00398FDC0C